MSKFYFLIFYTFQEIGRQIALRSDRVGSGWFIVLIYSDQMVIILYFNFFRFFKKGFRAVWKSTRRLLIGISLASLTHNQYSASASNSSTKNGWAYCDYVFSNLYTAHNSYGKVYGLWVVGFKKSFVVILNLKIDFYR